MLLVVAKRSKSHPRHVISISLSALEGSEGLTFSNVGGSVGARALVAWDATNAKESCFTRGGASKVAVSPSKSPQSSSSLAALCCVWLVCAAACGGAWVGAEGAVKSSKKLKVAAFAFPDCFVCWPGSVSVFGDAPNSAKRSADISVSAWVCCQVTEVWEVANEAKPRRGCGASRRVRSPSSILAVFIT